MEPCEEIKQLMFVDTEQEKEDIKLTVSKQITTAIKEQIDQKPPEFVLITCKTLKQLPKKPIAKLTHLINVSFSLRHVPCFWMINAIVIPKLSKLSHEVSSYRPKSLLPMISKLFKNMN